jgi:hypothetical protein
MNLYGWLIGRRTMDATLYPDDGGTHRGTGEIYFGWVLEGRASVRWSFSDITPDTFRWRGERSRDGDKSWQLQAEFLARRVP